MELENYELRDPARLIAEIARTTSLVEDTAHVALVHRPATFQRLLEVRRLELPALLDDGEDISKQLREAAQSFGLDEPVRPEHLLMTVVVRPGRCIMGPNEMVWCSGWSYSNHVQAMHTGDLMLVTEHGWLDFMTGGAGHLPRMAAQLRIQA